MKTSCFFCLFFVFVASALEVNIWLRNGNLDLIRDYNSLIKYMQLCCLFFCLHNILSVSLIWCYGYIVATEIWLSIGSRNDLLLTAPSHYLTNHLRAISQKLFARNRLHAFEYCTFNITTTCDWNVLRNVKGMTRVLLFGSCQRDIPHKQTTVNRPSSRDHRYYEPHRGKLIAHHACLGCN